jgi:hypothetical protein
MENNIKIPDETEAVFIAKNRDEVKILAQAFTAHGIIFELKHNLFHDLCNYAENATKNQLLKKIGQEITDLTFDYLTCD